jgi:hypothetical protein
MMSRKGKTRKTESRLVISGLRVGREEVTGLRGAGHFGVMEMF